MNDNMAFPGTQNAFGPIVLSAGTWGELTDMIERFRKSAGLEWNPTAARYDPERPAVSFWLARPVLH